MLVELRAQASARDESIVRDAEKQQFAPASADRSAKCISIMFACASTAQL